MYDIDLDLLRCFVVVAETKNFTLAGEKLNKSQSAISMRIKKLEEVLNTTLLQRTSRHVTLTSDGGRLLSKAKKLLSEGESLVNYMTEPALNGVIRIGLLEYIAPHRVSEIVAAIKARLPEASLSFRIGLSSHLKEELLNNNLDVALAIHDKADSQSTLLVEDELVWVASDNISVMESPELNLCLMKAPCFYREKALIECKNSGISVNEITTSSSILSMREMISSGLGFSLMGKSALGKGIHQVAPEKLGLSYKQESVPIALIGSHPDKEKLAAILTEVLVRDFL